MMIPGCVSCAFPAGVIGLGTESPIIDPEHQSDVDRAAVYDRIYSLVDPAIKTACEKANPTLHELFPSLEQSAVTTPEDAAIARRRLQCVLRAQAVKYQMPADLATEPPHVTEPGGLDSFWHLFYMNGSMQPAGYVALALGAWWVMSKGGMGGVPA